MPDLADSKQLTVHRNKKTVNHEPLTVNKRQRRLGFTLIELLVVISIIAILLAVATVSYTNAQQKGRDNKRKSDLKAVQQALEIYFNQNGKYPPEGSTEGQIGCDISGGSFAWGIGNFTCNSVTYMNPLPSDPITINYPKYRYVSNSPNQTYKLYAKIENSKDKDLTNINQANCPGTPPDSTYQTDIGGGTMQYFCVINP